MGTGIVFAFALLFAIVLAADKPVLRRYAPKKKPGGRLAGVDGEEEVGLEVTPERAKQMLAERFVNALQSPPINVGRDSWMQFVKCQKVGRVGDSDAKRVGMFGLRRVVVERCGISPPEKILSNPLAQYKCFVADVRRAERLALESGMVGSELGGQVATMSGLIAVARCGGKAALEAWSEGNGASEKFPFTAKMFELCNGIF